MLYDDTIEIFYCGAVGKLGFIISNFVGMGNEKSTPFMDRKVMVDSNLSGFVSSD